MSSEGVQVKTFCRMCMARCGLQVTIEEGKATSVKIDHDSRGAKQICPKGLALPEILGHPDRLKHPQKRQGERGEGKWAVISWDEALGTIADKLADYRNRFGAESVMLGLGDPKGLEIAFAQRFASTFGTPNITTPGHLCHMPGELAANYTFGSTCLADSTTPPKCIIVWGSNLSQTHSSSMSEPEIRYALDRGAKLIVIDPQETKLASKADIWLKLRPGSDGALALGMLKIIMDEELYDEQFVAEWTVGFGQLKEQLSDYSRDKVSEISWLPKEQIEQAARLYSQNRPATILWGNALDHTMNSLQACRAICILRAITGNLDIPGGDLLSEALPITKPGHFMLLREFPRQYDQIIGGEFKLATRAAFIPRQSMVKAILEEKACPIKAALFFGTNPLLTYPNARDTYTALMKLDFIVVAELFMTPTAELADVVLPAATNLEFDEVAPYPASAGFILAYPKVVEPLGDCWPDAKIINELAKRLGLGKYFWPEYTEALNHILEPSGLSYEEFKEKRILQSSKEYKKYEKGGFRTPSGKVEIYSHQLQELGYSPLPIYNEPPETPFSSPELAKEYPLVLTNAKEASFCHSALRNIPSLRAMAPGPLAMLNSNTASELGLKEGDWIKLETKRGSIEQKLSLNDSLDPRVVVASYGWWFPEDKASELYHWDRSNINILTDNEPPYEPALGSPNLRGILCKISKA